MRYDRKTGGRRQEEARPQITGADNHNDRLPCHKGEESYTVLPPSSVRRSVSHHQASHDAKVEKKKKKQTQMRHCHIYFYCKGDIIPKY